MSETYLVSVNEYVDKDDSQGGLLYSLEIFSEDGQELISYARGCASIVDAAYDAFKGVEL